METRILESVLYTGSFYFLRHSVIERLLGKGKILLDGTLEDIKKGNADIDTTVAELYRTYDI